MTRSNLITTPRHELRTEKARRNKEAALNAFIGKKAEIDEMLARACRRTATTISTPAPRRSTGAMSARSRTMRAF